MICLLLTTGANDQGSCEATLMAVFSQLPLRLCSLHTSVEPSSCYCFIPQIRHILTARYLKAFLLQNWLSQLSYADELAINSGLIFATKSQEIDLLAFSLISMIVQPSLKSVTNNDRAHIQLSSELLKKLNQEALPHDILISITLRFFTPILHGPLIISPSSNQPYSPHAILLNLIPATFNQQSPEKIKY